MDRWLCAVRQTAQTLKSLNAPPRIINILENALKSDCSGDINNDLKIAAENFTELAEAVFPNAVIFEQGRIMFLIKGSVVVTSIL